MTSKEFVEAVYDSVYKTAILNTMSVIENVPGKRPDKKLVNVSKWFNCLSPSDKIMIENIVKLCAEEAVFGFFAILDGIRQVESSSIKGELELFFAKDNMHYLINDKSNEYLHDIFKGML